MAATKKTYWLKSGIFSILEKGSVFVFGFGSFAILVNEMSVKDYGIWVVFYTVTAFFEVARIGLQQNALVKYLSTAEAEDASKIGTASLFNNIILTLFSILILFTCGNFIGHFLNAPELGYFLKVYCLTTILLIPFQQFNFTQQAHLQFSGIFWSNFVSKGSFFTFVLVMLLAGAEVTTTKLVYFQIVTAVLGSLTSYFFARKYLSFSSKLDWSWTLRLFNFGRFVFGTNLSTMLYKNIDKLMLSAMIGPEVTGIYEVAIKFTNLVDVPTFSIAAITFPQSARKMKEEGKTAVKRVYEKSVAVILTLLLPFLLFIFVFAEQIIHFMAKAEYAEAVPVLRVTILFGLFIPYAVQFGTIMDSMGKPKLNFRLTLVMATMNLILNYVFIQRFGIIGAAYGTLLAWAIVFIIGQVILYRLLDVRFYNAFLRIPELIRDGIGMAQKMIKKEKKVPINSEL